MGNYSDNEFLLLSGIQHFSFCRRQWALIQIEQQWEDNILTFDGTDFHAQVDDPFFVEMRGTVLTTRSLPIVSKKLGLYGVADLVEFYQAKQGIKLPRRPGFWQPHPVEYKVGKPKTDDCDTVQLCAQGICMEEMLGIRITEGDIFYGRTRRRTPVKFDDSLKQRVMDLAQEMHRLYNEGVTPLPEQTMATCKSCSLVEICMPRIHERRSVRRYFDDALRETE